MAAAPLAADVAGFDPTIDDAFWTTTGRVDVPANSRASSTNDAEFSTWDSTFRVSSAHGEAFETRSFTKRESSAYDKPFWTVPAGFYIVVQ